MDSFRSLSLPGFFRIGVNSRPHISRRLVVTQRVSYRFTPQTALEPHLILANTNFLD